MTDEYLYCITPKRGDMLATGLSQDEKRIANAHFEYLKTLNETGVVRFAGRTANDDAMDFGVVVLRVHSLQEAKDIMQGDPAVKFDLMTAELFPFRTVFHSM